MKNRLFLLLLLIIPFFVYSQEKIKRVYEISVINYPQIIELIEFESGEFSGNIITKITKGKNRTSWLNRTWRSLWRVESKEIMGKTPLDEKVVEKVMSRLKENGIETIKKCSDDKECDNYRFLDSGAVAFRIKLSNSEREYQFDEIYPLKEDNKEKIELRFKAQKLITILYEHIDVNQGFADLLETLPKGYYHWYRASGHSIVTINNRKLKKTKTLVPTFK